MIGIIGAMSSEIDALKENVIDLKVENISGIDFYIGKIHNKDVVIAKCGIGKVFASVCVEAMILKYHPKQIIHIGIAGSLIKELSVRDVAIAEAVVQYDIDQTAFDMPLGFIQDLELIEIPCSKTLVNEIESCAKNINVNYKTGIIASGDKFISNDKDKEIIKDVFDAIAVDMESAATGQVCYINNIDFIAIRAMSDGGDDDAVNTYNVLKQQSADIATKILLAFLNT